MQVIPSIGAWMSKRFLDSPAELERRIDRLVEHFRHGEYLFFNAKPHGIPNPRELFWLLLCEAMHTTRLLPDRERAMISRMPSSVPTSRVTIDQAYSVELSRLLDNADLSRRGLQPRHEAKVRETANEAAVDRMVDILDLLRFVVGGRAGKDAQRMKRVVMARAAGLTIEQCGRIWDKHRIDFDRRSFHDIKSMVVGQVLKGIETEFGLVRTSRGFRRLTVREIERKKKLRKRLQTEAQETANAG